MDDLLKKIEREAAARNMAPATLTNRALNDGKVPKRLANGGSITLKSAAKLDEWLRLNSAQKFVKK